MLAVCAAGRLHPPISEVAPTVVKGNAGGVRRIVANARQGSFRRGRGGGNGGQSARHYLDLLQPVVVDGRLRVQHRSPRKTPDSSRAVRELFTQKARGDKQLPSSGQRAAARSRRGVYFVRSFGGRWRPDGKPSDFSQPHPEVPTLPNFSCSGHRGAGVGRHSTYRWPANRSHCVGWRRRRDSNPRYPLEV